MAKMVWAHTFMDIQYLILSKLKRRNAAVILKELTITLPEMGKKSKSNIGMMVPAFTKSIMYQGIHQKIFLK